MTDIVIQTTSGGVPVNGLADPPEITILRIDTDAAVVTASAMSDQAAGGLYKFAFTAGLPGIKYSFEVDADPNVTGQVDKRTYGGAFDNEIRDLWNDHGLNPSDDKTITEVTEGEDYDEAVTDTGGPDIAKDVTKIGLVTTLNRAP